jgi:outer membrane protein insertion porin family
MRSTARRSQGHRRDRDRGGQARLPFVDVRPHANRDPAARIANVVFTLDDGPHTYVERINIHGNRVTRDG